MNGLVDMKTLIHAGIEVMAFGGLIYMFNKRIASLNDRIQELEEEQKKMKEVINRLASVVFGMPPPKGPPPGVVVQHQTPPGSPPTNQPPPPPPEPELTDEDLDALLGDELKGISGSVSAGDIEAGSEPLKKK